MSNAAATTPNSTALSCLKLAESVLPLAFGSLYHTMMYASLTDHPYAEQVADLVQEQMQILRKITTKSLIPFNEFDKMDVRMNWMNVRSESMNKDDPLIARYFELHSMRMSYLPAKN